MSPERPAATGGVRALGAASATMLVVASMVGTGVFTTSGLLMEALRSPLAVLAAWVVGGLLALCGALTYAELAAALPRNGGEYQLLGRIYHPAVGFAAGVVSLVVGFAAPLAASALAFGHYLAAAVPGVPPLGAAAAVIALLALVHGLDVGWGGRAQAAVTGAQLALVAGVAVAGLALGEPARLLAPAERGAAAAVLSSDFAVALVLVSFAYSGWNAAIYVAGEVKRPSRTLPLALAAGTLLVTALYVALNVVFLSAAPASELAGTIEVAHLAALRLAGPGAGRLLSGVVAVALASSVGAMIMAGARVYEAVGMDHLALSFLARRTRRGAPAVAVAAQAGLALVMAATSSFGSLLAYIGFTLSISAGLTVLGVFVLRRREPDLARPARTWGYPVTPLLFVGLSTWMVVRALVERPASSVAGLATVGVALALWFGLVRGARGRAASALGSGRS